MLTFWPHLLLWDDYIVPPCEMKNHSARAAYLSKHEPKIPKESGIKTLEEFSFPGNKDAPQESRI
jgi:hypothetical protein